MGSSRLDSSESQYGPVAGSCELGKEISESVKCEDFLNRWSTISFLRRTLFHDVSEVNGLRSFLLFHILPSLHFPGFIHVPENFPIKCLRLTVFLPSKKTWFATVRKTCNEQDVVFWVLRPWSDGIEYPTTLLQVSQHTKSRLESLSRQNLKFRN